MQNLELAGELRGHIFNLLDNILDKNPRFVPLCILKNY